MILKRHSLATKLFVAFLCTSIFVILVMMGLIGYQMRSGFSSYLLRVELQTFDDLAKSIAKAHRDEVLWLRLKEDPRRWHDLVRGSLGPRQPEDNRPSPPAFESATNGKSDPRPPKRPPQRPLQRPGPPQRPGVDPLMLGQRLALLTSAGNYWAGARLAQGSYLSRTVHAGDDAASGPVIAQLALASPSDGRSARDEQFLYQQFRALFWVCLLAVGLSALAAYLLARGLVTPIRSLVRGAQALSDGDYKTRLTGTGKDEIGQLTADFNLLAESLEAAEKAERQWMSDASHELKTPLAILKGRIEGLQDGVYETDAALLAEMHATVERLNRLVGDLNALSHLREGRLACHFQPEDVSVLLREVVDHSAGRFEEKGLALTLKLDASQRLLLVCDRGRLRQMMDNLLENARRYTDAPGVVEVTARLDEQKEALIVTIEDSAPCPDGQHIGRLFERFYRADPSRARQSGGTGLGLAICRAIVEAHDGQIEATRSELGGLLVRVTLPLDGDVIQEEVGDA
ncbi:ATP-binding protein [Cohaesibacter intestini]|uniref:ATP-binding protein n=1 Tax=Cohaesibacter intestini TaxID=2211145 RepID=UPI000DEA530E|nr:ATP-binding protein [Cohaesibacter intestini]